jgi:hypothetical protein
MLHAAVQTMTVSGVAPLYVRETTMRNPTGSLEFTMSRSSGDELRAGSHRSITLPVKMKSECWNRSWTVVATHEQLFEVVAATTKSTNDVARLKKSLKS